MNRFSHPPVWSRSRGFSLMEVLVALLVLAIGLLGLASLQAQSLKFNHDAYVRSQATMHVYELMDKMRATPAVDWSLVNPELADCTDPTAALADSSPEMTLCLWLQDLEGVPGDPDRPPLLPNGVAGIAQNGVDARMYDITLQWLDREIDAQADCLAIGAIGIDPAPDADDPRRSRLWDDVNDLCLVNQVWTVFP